jgi:hypothetical protein
MVNGNRESGIGNRESGIGNQKIRGIKLIKSNKMKLLFTLLLIVFSTQIFSQSPSVDPVAEKPARGTAAWHTMKKKDEKTVAFLLLSGGAILGVASLNSSLNFNWIQTEEERREERAAYTRAWIGLGAMVASVPFFISARSHKKKAALLLKNEKAFLPDPSQRRSFPAVGIAFRM